MLKFVHLGAASVALNGKPLYHINEKFESDYLIDGYSQTKLEAEKLVLSYNSLHFKTVVIRPPLIWGKDDPNTLPEVIRAINSGQMMLINNGKHRFVTCHVLNVCEALYRADKSIYSGKA